MKIAIILAALVGFVAAQTSTQGPQPTRSATELKTDLIQRAAQLQTRVKAEIQKLTDENRGHLSQLLKEEEQRVESLVDELRNATNPVQLAVLEAQLIDAEYRVDNEVNILQKETATQDLLLSAAKVLKEWVTDEIKNLEAETSNRAHEVARLLRREELNLEQIAQQLSQSQNQRRIEVLEVELRSIEVRLYEALRALHYQPATDAPVTRTEAPTTTAEPTEGTTEAPVTTGEPTEGTTEAPVTTAEPTEGPTDSPTNSTTVGPTEGPTTGASKTTEAVEPSTAQTTTGAPVEVTTSAAGTTGAY